MGLTFATPNGGNSAMTGYQNKNNNASANKQTSNGGRAGSGGTNSAAEKLAKRLRDARNKANNTPAAPVVPKVVAPTTVVTQGSPHERNVDLVSTVKPVVNKTTTTPKADKNPVGLISSTATVSAGNPIAKVTSSSSISDQLLVKSKTVPVVDKKTTTKPPITSIEDTTHAEEFSSIKVNPEKPVNTDPYAESDRFTTSDKKDLTVKPLEQGSISLGSSDQSVKDRHLDLQKSYQEPVVKDKFNTETYDAKAEEGKNSKNILFDDIIKDKYRNDGVSYNQAYWMGRMEGGATQAEMEAEQKALGSKKTYSGDLVVSKEDQARSKYILESILRSGIEPTTTTETSGLLDERVRTTNSYDIGTGKPVTTTNDLYSPKIGGVSFGDDVTKTYVNGIDTYTKTGEDDKVTSSLGAIDDRVDAGADVTKELSSIDSQIKTETDPIKLKALHKRRLMLMRMNRTSTRFAGLLDDADTKRSKMSILYGADK